jgi:polyhydroxyalkanoate synthesis regulator phasin
VKLSKTLVLPLAAILVVVGTGAVLASTGGLSPSTIGAVAPAADPSAAPAADPASPAPSAASAPQPKVHDALLRDVLDDLVANGTISAAQEQAILDAVDARRAELKAQRQAQREALKAQRQQIRQFLADGVITQDELDQLPADSPLRQLTSLMDDGKITIDELRQLGRDLLGGRGHKLFPGLHPDASRAPSASPTNGG